MDGIHDLGGRHGFGKVINDEQTNAGGEIQFQEPYEARVRAMVTLMTPAPDWNIDWFRHCRELIDPADYLTRPYFDQWVQSYGAMLVNSGWATIDELSTGKSSQNISGVKPPVNAQQALDYVVTHRQFDSDVSAEPQFQLNDPVHTTTAVPTGHTRLPAYARGRSGTVIAHHGAHIFPDAMALNEKRYEHLYTIEFKCDDLWPESKGSADTVTLDLWESYLESV